MHMATYRADSLEAIEEIFDRDGTSLRRSGFNEPDMSVAPEGYIADDSTVALDGLVHADPVAEATQLGIDLDVYHQG